MTGRKALSENLKFLGGGQLGEEPHHNRCTLKKPEIPGSCRNYQIKALQFS